MADKVAPFYKDAVNAVDVGLRRYMLNVFSYMSGGLALTAVIAYLASRSQGLVSLLFSNPLVFFIIALAPLGISIYLSMKIATISMEKAKILFFSYAACLGISLASIFIIYSGDSVAVAFFTTSSMFLSMVIYGYVTEKDLTGLGSFLIMGVIGLIIASIVNMFVGSSAFMFVVSALGIVIFVGLTAYDTQLIKSYYFDSDTVEISEKKAIFGALRLYLDFINCFLYVLRFLGSRKN
ncbi:MAG: Bax inhibitor-1/YccA family protein [Holosporaceae bacterium]|jgi:FtsH-binding integral membrane protein|nr:Bax inhibitor-1/YccA family protein [Holosporaceae bacterium]